jgi:D-alanine transaminase
MSDILYINGRFTTTDERVLGVEDRGFLFGDAVYEVFKFLGKKPIFLAGHWRRLERGLRAIEIPLPWDERSFTGTMHDLLARTAFGDGIVYIQVSRGEAERTHFYREDMQPTVVAYSRRYTFPDAAKKEQGIRLITQRDVRWRHCDVKSVNLLANALAKKAAQRAGFNEALLVDDGLVREGASSNLFAVLGGRVVTHPLDEHILPGVTRDHAIALARERGIAVDERVISVAELAAASEVFVTATTLGVMPVVQIDDRVCSDGVRGAITTELQRAIDAAEANEISARDVAPTLQSDRQD